jgi:hypothetical protein
MLSEIGGQGTQTNTGKEVDSESGVLGVILGEQASEPLGTVWVLDTLVQHLQTQGFDKVLEQNLDKNTGTARGFLLVQVDGAQHIPAKTVR